METLPPAGQAGQKEGIPMRDDRSVLAVPARGCACGALLLLASAAGSGSVFGQTCMNQLGNEVYFCHVKSDMGTDFDDCFRFTAPGLLSYDGMDLYIDGLGDTLGCKCTTKGTFVDPDFNASAKFECISTSASLFAITFSGKSDQGGRFIIGGQAFSEEWNAFTFKCKRSPSCTTAAASAPGDDGKKPNLYRRPEAQKP